MYIYWLLADMELLSVDIVVLPSFRLFKRLRGGRLLPLTFGLGKIHLLPPIFVIRKLLRPYGAELDSFLGGTSFCKTLTGDVCRRDTYSCMGC